MSSVLRPVRKRKQGRTLGRVDILRREEYAALELDPKVELIRALVPLGLMHVEELLEAEVTALATPGRTSRPTDGVTVAIPARWGWPGSGCRFRCRGCGAWPGARSRCGRMRRCTARVG